MNCKCDLNSMLQGKVTFLQPAVLAFVRATGPYQASSDTAWRSIRDWLNTTGHVVVGNVAYGMALDDPRATSAETLRYDACVIKPPTLTSGDLDVVQLKEFEGGAYLLVRHVGRQKDIGSVVSEARDLIMQREGLYWDSTRSLVTMTYSFPPNEEDQICDICIPVIPDRRTMTRLPH